MREYHVRFRERLGVKIPLSTRPTWNCTYHIVFARNIEETLMRRQDGYDY